jgi:phosphate transport system substrate-binding protein
VIPGLREYLTAWSQAWNPGSYLAQHGMIPLPETERSAADRQVQTPRSLTAADLASQ